MKAIQVLHYGGAEVLVVREVPDPVPAEDEVLIRVHSSNVNFADVQTRSGNYAHETGPPFIPGLEAAGVVVTGNSVFSTGQRVVAFTSRGSYAELATATAELTFAVPDDISFDDVSGLTAAITAINLLEKAARLQQGETVLIHAAAGGVGSLAVQLASHLGAGQIIGTVGSDAKVAVAKANGCTHVINYRDADFGPEVLHVTGGRGVDVILDSVAGGNFEATLSCLADFGRLVVFGQSGGEPALARTDRLYKTNRSVLGYSSGHRRRHRPAEIRPVVERMFTYLRNGVLRIDISARFPLAAAAEAHLLAESRQSTGKILLELADRMPDASRKEQS